MSGKKDAYVIRVNEVKETGALQETGGGRQMPN